MGVQLLKKYDCVRLREHLDDLVKQGASLFDNDHTCAISGQKIRRMEVIESLLVQQLIEKTNFERVFDRIKKSYGDPSIGIYGTIRVVLCDIRKGGIEPKFEEFLKLLNDKITLIRRQPLTDYTFYFPTRIRFNRLNSDEFKKLKSKIKKAIGIEIRKPPKKDTYQDQK